MVFFNDTATTEIYTLSLHDALPISDCSSPPARLRKWRLFPSPVTSRSEEHTSELQSLRHLVCRLLLETKKNPSELQSLWHLVCRHFLDNNTYCWAQWGPNGSGLSRRILFAYSIRFNFLFFFNDTATTEIYTLSLHDALPI